MKSPTFLSVVTFGLLITNLFVLGYFGDYESRVTRFASMLIFFFIFLRSRYFKSRALPIFAALVVNDLLLISYEESSVQNLILLIRLSLYLLLGNLVLPYIRKIKVKLIEGLFFVGILVINFFLLSYMNDSIKIENSGWLEEALFYGYGTALIISISMAFTFYNRYSDNASIFFLLSLIILAMSDLTFFIGYYLEFHEFYFLDRGFNIIALGFLLHFISLFNRKIASGFYEIKSENL